MSFITLEEHFLAQSVLTAGHSHYDMFPKHILDKMSSLGESRLRDMDAGKVSKQVLSHGPAHEPVQVCVAANDELAAAVARHPDRLVGFAMLPMGDPDSAAAELERCKLQHGFVGALIENHVEGQFYDDERFWSVFGKAEALDLPIYIHPTFASDEMMAHYRGNYDDSVALALSAFGFGWHSETGLHLLKLFASGLFDRMPRLKIILGHMGELLPFQLERIITVSERWGRQRGLREVWRTNVWVTTSGMFALAPLACLLQTTTIDHVLFSVDYPFSTYERGLQFYEEIKQSGLLKEDELEKFAYRNAEALLGIRAH